MSSGMIYQEILRILRKMALPKEAEQDVIKILECSRKSSPLDFSYSAAHEAGLSREETIWRCAAVFFNFATADLADDVADGDCRCLEEKQVPGAQAMLQALASYALSHVRLPMQVLINISEDLIFMGGGQQVEIRTKEWDAERAKYIAERVAGRQYSAYLQILWGGTRLEPAAREIGRHIGNASQIAVDLISQDPRLLSLSLESMKSLVQWALDGIQEIKNTPSECVQEVLEGLSRPLRVFLETKCDGRARLERSAQIKNELEVILPF